MRQPVQAGQNGYGKIGRCCPRELDHGLVVRALEQISVHHFNLAVCISQQFKLSARHHHQISHRFQSGVIPNGAHIAVQIRKCSLAGRIDQFAMIDIIEVSRNAAA